ncbi:hypothetical protein ACAG39_04470 [Caldicellulosiruptoraceae bacterium PP1]
MTNGLTIGDVFRTAFQALKMNFTIYFAIYLIMIFFMFIFAALPMILAFFLFPPIKNFFISGSTTTSNILVIVFLFLYYVYVMIITSYISIPAYKFIINSFEAKMSIKFYFDTLKEIDIKRVFRFILLLILFILIILVGMFLFVIPGIYFALIFGFSIYIAADYNTSPIESLRKSAELTRGYRGSIFAYNLILFIIFLPISLISMNNEIISSIITIVVSFLFIPFQFAFYYKLKKHKWENNIEKGPQDGIVV